MKILKKFITMFLVTATVLTAVPNADKLMVVTVEAHGGRTDASGGHKDNKNVSGLGSYHYHCGGYPAHLHENGVCPYSSASVSIETPKTNVQTSTDTGKSNTASTTTVGSSAAKANEQTVLTSANQSVTISDTSYDNVAFNASYYASNNSDVYEACGDNAKALYNHFVKDGIKEGRQSSAQFCITAYKNNNKDLVDAFGDDLIKYYNHYIEHGCKENRVSK